MLSTITLGALKLKLQKLYIHALKIVRKVTISEIARMVRKIRKIGRYAMAFFAIFVLAYTLFTGHFPQALIPATAAFVVIFVATRLFKVRRLLRAVRWVLP